MRLITWYPPNETSILPAQTKGPFGSAQIPLTLDQLAAIDDGASMRFLLVDYGHENQLYDEDAGAGGGLSR